MVDDSRAALHHLDGNGPDCERNRYLINAGRKVCERLRGAAALKFDCSPAGGEHDCP